MDNQGKHFQRTTEDFTCEQCGTFVRGSGYTNHCPKCLWSKHVDVNPGDRQATCQGLMRPISVDTRRGHYVLLQRCTVCGHERRNRTSPDDSFDAILQISSQPKR